ncbi:hypothetical protein IPG41_02240 [Candidatus Peregrinibacteria bacterium]|nr:MAG: hypothetical protein IPG41_02240 [Candidatus Peregrinibacteria bacterium]
MDLAGQQKDWAAMRDEMEKLNKGQAELEKSMDEISKVTAETMGETTP